MHGSGDQLQPRCQVLQSRTQPNRALQGTVTTAFRLLVPALERERYALVD